MGQSTNTRTALLIFVSIIFCMSAKSSRAWLAAVLLAATVAAPSAAQAQSPGPNLLKNPAFDWPAQTNGDVCAPGMQKGNAITPHDWIPFWQCKSIEQRNQDQINRAPEFRVMTTEIASDRVRSAPTSGSFFTFWALNRSMGLYQLVDVTPGQKYRFSAWANLLTTDSDELPLSSSRAPGGLQVRACIHTAGIVILVPNMNDPRMVCGPWSRPYDTWGEVSVDATAVDRQIAVIIDTTADYPVKHNDAHVDDASLVAIGAGAAPSAAAVTPAQPQAQPQAQAQAAAGTAQVIVKTETANVRTQPSITSQILAAVPRGSAYAITAYTNDKQWFQIAYNSGVAYLHTSVVDLNAAAQAALGMAAQTTQPAAQPAAQAQPAASGRAQVVVNTDGSRLNIRETPTATGRILGKAADGTTLEVKGISPDKQWWRVTFAGGADGTAWVMAQFVTPNAAAKQLAGQ